MKRVYLLGAGFSKAVADLPIMAELIPAFERTLDTQRRSNRWNRVFWGETLLGFLDLLEQRFFVDTCLRDGDRYLSCSIKENLEALISFLDLNIATPIEATIEAPGGELAEFTKRDAFWDGSDLSEIRRCVMTYLYLTLIGPWPRSPLLRKFGGLLRSGDSVITFNYDLCLDTELWARRLWNPVDGYGLDLAKQEVSEKARFCTSVPIFKLHGSLNWIFDGLTREYVSLNNFYDDGRPIFSGFLENETAPLDRDYMGGHEPCWILPSFLKQFSIPPLLVVWENARKAIESADSLVVIGYSLPESDSAARLLLSSMRPKHTNLMLVDPNADKVRETYKQVTGVDEIAMFTDLEKFIKTS